MFREVFFTCVMVFAAMLATHAIAQRAVHHQAGAVNAVMRAR